jgi:MFS family permease
MALLAALLGWMFDGFEMGLFPLAARPALGEMLSAQGIAPTALDQTVGRWIGVMTAGFLVGASAGGVLFGWLGDRLGRVRAMTLSVLTYTVFSGLCGFVNTPWQLFALRFIAALGMGGEWSLGVSLVMELWPSRSRAWLAGLIGAASNVGFVMVALISLTLLVRIKNGDVGHWMTNVGLPVTLVDRLTANSGWRLLMICGALPALLTFLIRLFVPESERWIEQRDRGATRQWSSTDLLSVVFGTLASIGIITVWALKSIGPIPLTLPIQITVTILGLVATYYGFTYPIRRYLERSQAETGSGMGEWTKPRILKRLLVGAALSGVALLGTWASLQNAAPWASKLAETQAKAAGDLSPAEIKGASARASAYTQIAAGIGAIIGTILAALLGNVIGRRLSYAVLCLLSLGSSLWFFQPDRQYGPAFLGLALFAGGMTASFYGWLPLYLPELFPTRVRAFGQGFAFNFGRVLAAVGALQFGYLMENRFHGNFSEACSTLSFVYIVGLVVIWLAPETHRQPLPE